MRSSSPEQPLLDETMELPALSVAPGPPHPRAGRGSFSSSYSSYSSGVAGTDSSCSFTSTRIFDETDSHEVDLDDLNSDSSRADYALLSMPEQSAKRLAATTGIITRSNRAGERPWNSEGRAATAIVDALRELREGREGTDHIVEEEDNGELYQEEERAAGSVKLRRLICRLSTRRDLFVFSMGVMASVIHGALWSLLAWEVNAAVTAFTPFERLHTDSAALALMLLSLALGVTAYTAHLCLSHTAERQLRMLREQVLRHLLLDLDQSWVDTHASTVSSLAAELTRDVELIRRGFGTELSGVCRFAAQCAGSFGLAFMALWDVALAVSCVAPAVVSIIAARSSAHVADSEADAVASEALSNMQTLLALNGQRRIREKHAVRVRSTMRTRIAGHCRKSVLAGLLTGGTWAMAAIGLWYGGKKVYEARALPGDVLQTLLGVLLGSYALGHLLASLSAVDTAKRSVANLFSILETSTTADRDSVLNVLPRPAACSGSLVLVDVHFSYATRPERLALRGCNLTVAAGDCVAVVGDRRVGKSTLVKMLLRLYEPSQGLVLLDGREVAAVDTLWMRAQLGVVTQDATLFRASIFDNIAMGLVVLRELSGRPTGQLEERVTNAAQRADVHEFIMSLPDGYDTKVGENGAVLSVQQRQRIALARALIREPKVLLLDEMALSPQELLSRFGGAIGAGGTTTILFTRNVRSAAVQYVDKIAVLEAGEIVEQGTHTELLQRNGAYRRLFIRQGLLGESNRSPSESSSHVSLRRADTVRAPPPTKFTRRDVKALCRPERTVLAFGLVASSVVGLLAPLLGVLIGECIGDMATYYTSYLTTHDAAALVQGLRPLVMKHGLFLSAGAAVVVVFQGIQLFCLDTAAERVASHLRDLHFSSLLAQPLAFFDSPQHSARALTRQLATQGRAASLAVGRVQGYKLQTACTLLATLAAAFWRGSWMLTLVLVAAMPLLLIGQAFNSQKQAALAHGGPIDNGIETEDPIHIHTSEALSHRQTVVMLGLELSWCASFETLLQRPLRRIRRKTQLEALSRGFCAVVLVAASALTCWLSSVLVHDGDANFHELAHSLAVVVVSALSLSTPMSWLNGVDGSAAAGAAIFSLRDAANAATTANGLSPPPSCRSSDDEQDPMPQRLAIRGSVALHNVHFTYPTNPSTVVLDGLSLQIEAGQTVALCGPPGAGKSTVLALIDGFYALLPHAQNGGRILLDGVETRTLDVAWLRSQIGFVGPEPVLFRGTIAENIAYGMAVPPSLDDVKSAAQVAHAHAFISQLPDGYATRVGGDRQFSAGQRQRLALARAVLQDANLLLLDEPTRWLGAESERIAAQQALDTIVAQRVRRTTVIAAHPAESATVRNADQIFVLDGGRVVDQGTHAELLQLPNGIYARLFRESTWSPTSSSS